MPEFMVAIDHITYYAVRAEDEVTAIDLVLEGQGLEISSETRDAYISAYQTATLDHILDPREDCLKSHSIER
jgi:hypothetical protein